MEATLAGADCLAIGALGREVFFQCGFDGMGPHILSHRDAILQRPQLRRLVRGW